MLKARLWGLLFRFGNCSVGALDGVVAGAFVPTLSLSDDRPLLYGAVKADGRK